MNLTEQGIVRQLKQGDEKAYRYVFENYYSLLCRVAYAMLRDHFLAESMAGDVIFNLWEKRESIDIQVSVKAYLIRSVRNRCINYKQQEYVIMETRIDEGTDGELIDRIMPVSDEHPLNTILQKELEQDIKKSVSSLSDECRTVFEMSRFEDLRYKDIASKLNISINTVKYHIKKALSRLTSDLKRHS